jgi:hypothetical protein
MGRAETARRQPVHYALREHDLTSRGLSLETRGSVHHISNSGEVEQCALADFADERLADIDPDPHFNEGRCTRRIPDTPEKLAGMFEHQGGNVGLSHVALENSTHVPHTVGFFREGR